MASFTICESGVIKYNIRPRIGKMTIRTFSSPMHIRSWMAGAAGIIQRMVIAHTPAGGAMMAGFTAARIMTNGCQMTATA
jgi:hypothetical protein